MKEIFPDLVCEDEDGYLSVDYIGFIPILVDAVKSLKAEVEEQKSVIESLTAREKRSAARPGKGRRAGRNRRPGGREGPRWRRTAPTRSRRPPS